MESEAATGFERVSIILEHIAAAERPPTHTEIATELGIAKSTLSAVLATLRKSGHVEVMGRRYVPGPRLLALSYRVATTAFHDVALRDAMHPTIVQIGAETGETVTLSVEIGGDANRAGFILAIDHVASVNPLRFVSTIGQLRPIYDSAAGRAILAFSNRPVRALAEQGWISSGPIALDALEADLRAVRERGYALRVSSDIGFVSVAAPVFNASGAVKAAISVVGPLQRIRQDGGDILPILRDRIQRATDRGLTP